MEWAIGLAPFAYVYTASGNRHDQQKKADSSLRFCRMTNLYIPMKRKVHTAGAQYHILTPSRYNWGVVPVCRLKTCVK